MQAHAQPPDAAGAQMDKLVAGSAARAKAEAGQPPPDAPGALMDMLAAASAARATAEAGDKWFHAWISSRLIRKAATPIGSDTYVQRASQSTQQPLISRLHESIMAFQNGRRVTPSDIHDGYGNLNKVQADSKNHHHNRDTCCDFSINPDQPLLISFCCLNDSKYPKDRKSARLRADEMNLAFLQDLAQAQNRDPNVPRQILEVAANAIKLAVVLADGSFMLLAPAANAVRDLVGSIVGNSDGPLAFGVIHIENPRSMIANDENTDLSPVTSATWRCQNYTRGSDYEVEIHAKPMNKADRKKIGVP